MRSFCHLHTHTNYSLLDGVANIDALLQQTKLLGMDALAITDHGNLFGVPHFVKKAKKHGVKPIIGCEFYVTGDMHDRKDRRRYHQLLLAKNKVGYENLMKLSSMSFLEGFYYKPRIDRKLIKKHSEGLIATTCCLGSEINRAIIEQGEEAAEKIFLAWLDIFGEDYYIELQRYGIEELDICNRVLCKWAKKYGVKMVATNDVHYIKKEDSNAHDILLCIQTGKDFDDPDRMRFVNDQFYLKSPKEMVELFEDLPEAIENTQVIVDKIEEFSLEREILLPVFPIPEKFASQDDYLTHLTMEAAKKRYGGMSAELQERLDFELGIVKTMGFSGYYLIVQDIIQAAKKMGVLVGPGRGSVAGSAIAYVLGITDVEPLQYGLFFERFLNPERVSMPDMDIDFDDEGRQKVIHYIVEKYGYNQVAQIITFGSMAAKSAIRDVSRVLKVPLSTADRLAKLVPEKPGTTLAQAFSQVPELAEIRKKPTTIEGKVLATSEVLEGTPRHTGIHAAGLIIAPKNLMELIPLKTDKSANLLVTQYDGSVVESVGMLKMDLLGLKTLSILRDAVKLIEEVHKEKIDINCLPLDDAKTFELYQKGHTIGVFQFEGEGIREALKKQQPSELEHLIAMNALYRPGPMANIPTYIARMHGKEEVSYMHPLLEEILASTYGIPVYQEQIMQMAQKIAGYTLGQADLLRRAMGKKKPAEMAKQQAIFIKGAKEHNGIEKEKALEIFDTMSKFAQYGFNRSHAAAYTLLSYQTAYLKAHYPAAYMAAVLTHNRQNITKVSFFINECQRMNISVDGPDINKSQVQFSNTSNSSIRFGLSAVKGVGEQAMALLTQERKAQGVFKDFHDLVYRLIVASPTKMPSRKMLENLACVGALDSLGGYHRKQYVQEVSVGKNNYVQDVLKYEQKRYKEDISPQQSLFAFQEPTAQYGKRPQPPTVEPYTYLEKLAIEKELVGFYMAGHPLSIYRVEIKFLCNANTQNLLTKPHGELRLAGMVTKVARRQNKSGGFFGTFTLEDYEGTRQFVLFGEQYSKHKHLLEVGQFLYIKGRLQKRFGQQENLDFRPQSLELLTEAANKYFRQLQIKVAATSLDNALVEELVQTLQAYPGKCRVQLVITEEGMPHPLHSFSQKYRVTPSTKLFAGLDGLKEVSFSLEVAHG